jgi:murein DD-endopeptidase MepM/ murein hydrolase activator NlpD
MNGITRSSRGMPFTGRAEQDASIVGFPLEGEWAALRTPAHRIPSHGTDFLGQRYAYDFVRRTTRRAAPFGPSILAHSYGVARSESFAGWGAAVVAVEDGHVGAAMDGWPDHRYVNALATAFNLHVWRRFQPVRITRDDWRALAGNYVLVEGTSGASLYAHLQRRSIYVAPGDSVRGGERLGLVGNSGQSSMPHLHFHLMDRADGLTAQGRLCGFRTIERWNGESWVAGDEIPRRNERIRSASLLG